MSTTSLTYDNFAITFLAVYISFIMILGRRALRTSSPITFRASGLVFSSSATLMRVLILCILLPVFMGILLTPLWWSDIVRGHFTWLTTIIWAIVYFSFYDLLPLGLFALSMNMLPGPQELRLDKKEQTYWLRSGTFLKPHMRSGTWKDIRGIYVRPICGKGGSIISYGVYIAWIYGLSGGPPLGLSSQQDGAEQQAKRLASEIGLQFVLK